MLKLKRETELSELNDHLILQLDSLKGVRTGSSYLDTSNFIKVASSLEGEFRNVRKRYDIQLSKLRKEVADVKSEISKYDQKHQTLRDSFGDLKDKIEDQLVINNKLKDFLNDNQQLLTTKTADLQNINIENSQREMISTKQSCNCRNKLEQTCLQNKDLTNKIRSEELAKNRAKEMVRRLEQEMEHKCDIAGKERKAIEVQMAIASARLLNLESKAQHTTHPDDENQLDKLLNAVKSSAQTDIVAYKQDAKRAFEQQMTMLQAEADRNRQSFIGATSENKRLITCVEELNAKIRMLQSQITSLGHDKRAAEENLKVEQDQTSKHMQALRTKFYDEKEILFDKMEELSLLKSQNYPLETEADALYQLIDEESHRLGMQVPKIQHCNVSSDERLTSELTDLQKYLKANERGPRSARSLKDVVPLELGRGKDYFKDMFHKKFQTSKSTTPAVSISKSPVNQLKSNSNVYRSSLGPLVLFDVSKDGRHIIIHNSSDSVDIDIGGYKLQQNRFGSSLNYFQFPKVLLAAGGFVTIYAGSCSAQLHQPPGQFVWKSQQKFYNSSESTTVLCRPDGKAVAWLNAAKNYSNVPPVSPDNSTVLTTTSTTQGPKRSSVEQRRRQSYDTSTNRGSHSDLPAKGNRRVASLHSASGVRMGSSRLRRYVPPVN